MNPDVPPHVAELINEAREISRQRIETLIFWNRGLCCAFGLAVLFIVIGWTSFREGVLVDIDAVNKRVDGLAIDIRRLEEDALRVENAHNGFVREQLKANQRLIDVLQKTNALLERKGNR